MRRKRTVAHSVDWHVAQMESDDLRDRRYWQQKRSAEKMRRHDLATEAFLNPQPICPHGYVGGTCSVCEWMKGKR